jgi:cytochrome c oxidase subunit IV
MADTESRFQEEIGTEDMPDPREASAPHREHPSAKEYIRIGILLGVLTALEVASYYVDVNTSVLIPTLFTLAFIKFVLVVLWFMHLRFDDRRYARFFVMGLALAATLFLVVLISFRAFLV